jgi:TatD DNase family protein
MIDSHCHINDEVYRENPENYVKEAEKTGVFQFLVVGCDEKTSKLAVDISSKISSCYAAVGIHPSDSKNAGPNDLDIIKSLALKNKKVIAIGEIGLDYYWDKDEESKTRQREYLKKQIQIANELQLPISIHCREAIDECLKILKENPVKLGGVMHCYAGSLESAREFIKLGFVLGFGGTVTFKNSVRPKEVVANIPSDSYVLETDAPYLAPDPYRGKENHSKYLYLIRDKIASLRNATPEQVEKETTENFKRVFRI